MNTFCLRSGLPLSSDANRPTISFPNRLASQKETRKRQGGEVLAAATVFPPCHGQAWRVVASSRLPADNAAKQRRPPVFPPSSLAFMSPLSAALPPSRQPCWWHVSNPANQKGRSIRPPLPNVYSGRTPIMASLLRTLHSVLLHCDCELSTVNSLRLTTPPSADPPGPGWTCPPPARSTPAS